MSTDLCQLARLDTAQARRGALAAIAAYVGAAAASTLAAVVALRLHKADLRIPFAHGGDSLFYEMLTKSIAEGGWYWNLPRLGAPGTLDLYDFPAAETLHLLALKTLSLFSSNWALLFNLFYLLGFPIITVSALAVFRRCGVGFLPAVVGSMLFAFLPSRLLVGQAHLFVDTFAEVPLVILVALWVSGDRPPLLDLRSRRSWAALIICAITGSTGLYYAFFGGCLLVAGGAWASIRRRSARNVIAGVALAGVIVTALGVNALPSLVHRAQHGGNSKVGARSPREAEIYGLRIAQLLLPTDGHRIPALRRLKDRYNVVAPFRGESSMTSLGWVAGTGFLILLGVLLVGAPRDGRPRGPLWQPLAALTLTAVLLGTMGGFGSLFAFLVTPQIRTYCRLNVFIAFLGLFAIVLLLDRLAQARPRVAKWVLPLVLGVGLYDQATPAAVPPYAAVKRQYQAEAAFFDRIERSLPAGAMIFELPYVTFPEGGAVGRVDAYDELRPYLHCRTLRWSFPTTRGRPGDAWTSAVSRLPPAELLGKLSAGGFAGLLIDRGGYPDGGAALEGALGRLLGTAPLIGGDRRLAFFPLNSAAVTTTTIPPPAPAR
jgi:phosphoglycerol transferase